MIAQSGIRAWLAPRARVRIVRLINRIDARMGDDSIAQHLRELHARIDELGAKVDQLAARTDQLAYEAKMERRATDEGLSAVLERLRQLEGEALHPAGEPAASAVRPD